MPGIQQAGDSVGPMTQIGTLGRGGAQVSARDAEKLELERVTSAGHGCLLGGPVQSFVLKSPAQNSDLLIKIWQFRRICKQLLLYTNKDGQHIGSHPAAQVGVQFCDLGSLQPRPPMLKESSHLSLPGSWNHRCTPPHHANFVFFVELESCHVAQASLKHLSSSDLPTPAPQSVGITGASPRIWSECTF
ncbi:Protein GVQW1 [Plecturocebus cupreus]